MTADCINCIVKWCAKSGKYSFGDTCEDFSPIITNADRLCAMSVEEMAEFLAEYRCAHKAPHCREANCEKCWLDWLKQEVE